MSSIGAEPSRASTLRKKAARHHRRVPRRQGADGAHQHLVESRIGVPLLGDLVDHLQHHHGHGHPVEVFADGPEGVDHLDLVDHVQVASSLPARAGRRGSAVRGGIRTWRWSAGRPWPPPAPCRAAGSSA